MIALLALFACVSASDVPRWRIVSAYDLAAADAAQARSDAAGGTPAPPRWLWRASQGMVSSCGAPKGADGLGVTEAQAIADGLTPALALVLERRPGTTQPPTRHAIRLAIGRDVPEVPLQPAVAPRALATRISGSAEPRHLQLVRTQLQMEMCLEHETGRGWIGGSAKALRQAFLLDPPDRGGDDRLYFGGQRDAIPALLGPPDACIDMDGPPARPSQARGQESLSLVPSDVWGAWIRPCGVGERAGSPVADLALPFTPGGTREPLGFAHDPRWDGLDIRVDGGPADADVQVTVGWNGMTVVPERPLFPSDTDGGMIDLLARVPYAYPTFGPDGDTDEYALLVVPNWQIVEAMRRMGEPDASVPAPDGGEGVTDGVGWILSHPEYLFVQTPADETADDPRYAWIEPSPSAAWSNLADALAGGRGARAWGYTVAGNGGTGPIALAGDEAPSAFVFSSAHRARYQATFVLAAALATALGLVGFRRVRDLWTPIPEERVDYWPGVEASPPRKDPPGGTS